MNVVLIFSVLILVTIAIWQVTKIFELSQEKKVSTQVADDNDNDWNGKLMFAFLIFIYGITIFSFWSNKYPFPLFNPFLVTTSNSLVPSAR